MRIILTCLFALAAFPAFAGDTPPPSPASNHGNTEYIKGKLDHIIIPKIAFREVTVSDAVEWLRRKSVELDTTETNPERKGVNIVFKVNSPPSDPAVRAQNAKITLTLTDIPLGEALRYVTELAGLKLTIDPSAVNIVPVDSVQEKPAPASPVDAKQIEATLVPDKTPIMLGEPVCLTLTLINKTNRELMFGAAPGYSDGDRPGYGINLSAVEKNGAKVPAFAWYGREPVMFIGGLELQGMPASGTTTFQVFVPWRVAFEHAGSYTLTATFDAGFFLPGTKDADGNSLTADVPMIVSTNLDVVPADKKKMAALIEDLEKKTSINLSYGDKWEAERKLESITDERVIPWWLRKLNDPRQWYKIADLKAEVPSGGPIMESAWRSSIADSLVSVRIEALYALSKFNNDEALEALKKTMEVKSVINPVTHKPDKEALHYLREGAADCLLHSPHPGAIPILLTYHGDPDDDVRHTVVAALGTRVPPVKAIPLLRKMAGDKAYDVSKDAKQYLDKLTRS